MGSQTPPRPPPPHPLSPKWGGSHQDNGQGASKDSTDTGTFIPWVKSRDSPGAWPGEIVLLPLEGWGLLQQGKRSLHAGTSRLLSPDGGIVLDGDKRICRNEVGFTHG